MGGSRDHINGALIEIGDTIESHMHECKYNCFIFGAG